MAQACVAFGTPETRASRRADARGKQNEPSKDAGMIECCFVRDWPDRKVGRESRTGMAFDASSVRVGSSVLLPRRDGCVAQDL